MDIKSANKAHSIEHKIEDRLLKTDYYDPSSFNVDSNCDRATSSPLRITPEDCGPGPGGGGADFNENSSRSSHTERRDFRPGIGGTTASGQAAGSSSSGGSRYDDAFGGRQASSRSSRSYRTGSTFDRYYKGLFKPMSAVRIRCFVLHPVVGPKWTL